ncbi:MAG: hypothetical protein A3A96_03965 [Candidatus Zambryskibacteria bacterium RIFCSPLOWO2_01_FULL_39_39]|uniref:Thioredoxin domain-containing protein n=1 Tax=Candidatus Zambryskibacteria bacterium RIFCSPLOWO2_01_FULL_39_39 TaxID=1802758 RepID=A0A1G2TZ41_9BACT|nr:MAG: Sodium/proton antiporter [Parcubacteria group bacterium GW2011_GWA1_38_7]OHA87103.1 MAG: hypothetical protein A2644_03550 [Candidatus Zambryskibacteria bacterium RIFCSPHIGHO2_01_FULL_39_63]OHA94644.1 MAG: hypothetical protein A3B88_00355 [Candidatus Zambryskibacteria bacterium RIFCSPHIGHO2_02_FULL_39_19]OHA98095.1 MAG: hypothetical protein A3F20_01255 [Candidatus Zambryskibacteria bacterium RIFCSPHIGHO2_12_FULL_39_21]OHB02558.1 MAG: hypothetical protein A3A96_03965 [Candidatus Zambryski
MNEQEKKTKAEVITAPIAIIIAGALIAGAVYFSANKGPASSALNDGAVAKQQLLKGDLNQMAAISASDHIRGNLNAEVLIVEYSDTECPFCKVLHNTMNEVMDEYGGTGKVAWVFRHFPLDNLHPKARSEAVALECANEQGGNDKFWAYADRLFEVTPSNNRLDSAELPKIAEFVGLNISQFNTCLASGKYTKRIDDDIKNAQATGGNGTPWSIVVAKNGKKYQLSGAQPLASIKQLIETALQEK